MLKSHTKIITQIVFIFIAICISTFLIFNFVSEGDRAGFILIYLACIVFLLLGSVNSKIAPILIVALILRLALVLLNTYGFPDLDPDPDGYSWRAYEWSKNGFSEALNNFTTGAFMYSWLISIIYSLTGESQFTIRAINILLSTLSLYNIYCLSFLLWQSKKNALRTAWILAFFPNDIRFSSSFSSRESFIIYFFTAAILLLALWLKKQNIIYLILSLPLWMVCISLHTGFLVGLFAILFIICFQFMRAVLESNPKAYIQLIISLITILLTMGVIISSGWGLEKFITRTGGSGDLEQLDISEVGTSSAIGRAAYLKELQVTTPISFIWITPIRSIYFLFTPFVWMVKTPLDTLGLLDASIYIFLFIRLYIERQKIMTNYLSKYILITIIFLICTFALSTSNYGTAIRHRTKFIHIILALVSVSLKPNNKNYTL
jgi:hypothetical protein